MKKIIIILALFVFIASMGCVSANDNQTVIPIFPIQDDFMELQSMIDDADYGDTINLTRDYNIGENSPEITIVNKTIAINGNGFTLNAIYDNISYSRIFNINENSEVYLSNIRFIGGFGDHGGAIYSDGLLHISDCDFTNNVGELGAAVYSSNSLNVHNTIFDRNYALDSGGAIYAIGDLIVENSTFQDNYANYSGGAISCFRADTAINDSQFNNNDAQYYGGSVHGGQILSIYNSMFESTNESVEIMDYYSRNEVPGAYLYLEGNYMNSPCPFSIWHESLNPIVSSVTLEFLNGTTFQPLKTEVAKIYDDMGNIIRYNDTFTMKIYEGNTLVEETDLSYDEDMGGYFYECDLSDGVYTLTGTLPDYFAENLTVIDGVLIVENSSGKIPSQIDLVCDIYENNVTLIATVTPENATGSVKFRVNDIEYYTILMDAYTTLTLNNLAAGNYTVSAYYEGDSMYKPCILEDVLFTIEDSSLHIEASDINMVYRDGTSYDVQLVDSEGNPVALAGETVKIGIVGKTYSRLTNADGIASLPINLAAGTYNVSAQYENSYIYNVITVNRWTIAASDVMMIYRDGTSYDVQLVDGAGNPAARSGETVKISIVGNTYNRVTNADGIASLPINLAAGTYNVSAQYGNTVINNVISISRWSIEASDVRVEYKNGSYDVQLIDGAGNPVALSGQTVKITIIGKTYNRVTNANGIASLPINLALGKYNVTAQYGNTIINNVITVYKISIAASDVKMTYKDGSSYNVQLIDNYGSPVALAGKTIKIRIDGNPYNRVTNASGTASLPLNLGVGTYSVTAEYGDTLIRNSIYVYRWSLKASDVIMTYKDGSSYNIQLVDGSGNPVARSDQYIYIRIAGNTYTKKTNASGAVSLPINLAAGTYGVSAQYENNIINNVITVYKWTITASDLNMTYKDGSSYNVQLVDGSGNPVAKANEIVKITVLGKTYTFKTNSEGVAALPINLAAGKYTISAEYNNRTISNTITVNRA